MTDFKTDNFSQAKATSIFFKAKHWLTGHGNIPEARYILEVFKKFENDIYDEKKTIHFLFDTTPVRNKIFKRNLLFFNAVKLLISDDISLYKASFSLAEHIAKFYSSAYEQCKTGSRKFKNDLEKIIFECLEIDSQTIKLQPLSIYQIVKEFDHLEKLGFLSK